MAKTKMKLSRPSPRDRRSVMPRSQQKHACPFRSACPKQRCIKQLPMLGHLDEDAFRALAALEKRLRTASSEHVRQEYYAAKLRLMAIIARGYEELRSCGILIEIGLDDNRTPLEGFPFLPGFAHVTKLVIDGTQVAGKEGEIIEMERKLVIRAEIQEGAIVLLAMKIMEAANEDRELLLEHPIEDLDLERVISTIERRLKAA